MRLPRKGSFFFFTQIITSMYRTRITGWEGIEGFSWSGLKLDPDPLIHGFIVWHPGNRSDGKIYRFKYRTWEIVNRRYDLQHIHIMVIRSNIHLAIHTLELIQVDRIIDRSRTRNNARSTKCNVLLTSSCIRINYGVFGYSRTVVRNWVLFFH